jgi:hypothetical protein
VPTLKEWRHVLASAASTALSVPEVGYGFPVLPWAAGKLGALPCALVQQGGDGQYVTPSSGPGTLSTLCQLTGTFRLWLVAADPLTEQAADVVDDMLSRIYGPAFRAACRADDLNPHGAEPKLGAASDPAMGEFDNQIVWWAAVPMTVPVHLS